VTAPNPQPGGVEGRFAVGEFVNANNPAIAQRVDLIEAGIDGDPARPARCPKMDGDKDLLPGSMNSSAST
jgi:hypothetical protein